jgi:hypothetical protein
MRMLSYGVQEFRNMPATWLDYQSQVRGIRPRVHLHLPIYDSNRLVPVHSGLQDMQRNQKFASNGITQGNELWRRLWKNERFVLQ